MGGCGGVTEREGGFSEMEDLMGGRKVEERCDEVEGFDWCWRKREGVERVEEEEEEAMLGG